MVNSSQVNRSKVVRCEILYQITPLKFWLRNVVAHLWTWSNVQGVGGRVDGQNANERFEQKINDGFVFSVSKLVEKHSCDNFMVHF